MNLFKEAVALGQATLLLQNEPVHYENKSRTPEKLLTRLKKVRARTPQREDTPSGFLCFCNRANVLNRPLVGF